MNLERFQERLQTIVPPAMWDQVWASFSLEKPVFFRTNTIKTTTDELIDLLKLISISPEKLEPLSDCLYISSDQKPVLSGSDLVNQGYFYIQGLSSQIASLLLAPEPGEIVLDLAAAPGGKTSHLAMLLKLEGELSAVEPVKDRFFRMKDNLKRLEADQFVRCYMHDGRLIGKKTPNRFDRVLIDAPCSSEGRLDLKDPETFQFWSEKKIKDCQRKQKALLRSAIDAARPGGEILYATCSMSPEENEMVVQHTLKRLGDRIELLPIEFSERLLTWVDIQKGLTTWLDKTFPDEISKTVRILPGKYADAFYMALIRKK